MTPDTEQKFIALWQQGLSHEVMAQRLGCPVGTVKSRSYTLVRQGKIQPRQPGRAAPQPTAPARQQRAPAQSSAYAPGSAEPPPVHTVHRVQAQLYALHGTVQKEVESPIDLRDLLSEALAPLLTQLAALEGEVKALRAHPSAPVQSGVYALHGAEQSTVAPEDRKSERWNIYMPRWLRRLVEQEAAAARLSPSQVLQDVVKAWAEGRQQGEGQTS
jgi:hypothetical protein